MPLQAGFTRSDQMMARHAAIVGAVSHPKKCFGGDNHLIAAAFDRFSKNFFGCARRINIRRIEHIDARLEADIHEMAGFLYIGGAPGTEKSAAAEGAGAVGKDGDLEAGFAKLSEFHGI